MKKISTQLTAVIIFLFQNFCIAQSTGINYSFLQTAGMMVFNNSAIGAVTLIPGGSDDVVTSFTVPATWSGFYFGSRWFPQGSVITVSSNGWLSLSAQANALPINSLSSTPLIIAPLWDDLKVHTNGEVSYRISGGVGVRALVVEWRGMLWDNNATDSALSFQAIIYDNAQTNTSMRNVIEFHYKRNGLGSINVNNGSGGASIGISGFCAGDVYAFTDAVGAPDKSAPENSSIALKPQDVFFHRFTPAVHPNNECADAEVIPFDPTLPLTSVTATTLHATQSAGNLPACGSPSTTGDAWFTFTKPSGITNFEIYTDSLDCRGVNFSTGIEIFSSCGGAPLTCDLGSAGPIGTNAVSYINMTNQSCNAQQYWVRAYSSDTSYRGYFRFNIRPPGGFCANANDITGCGLPYTSSAGLTTCGFGNEYDSSNSVPHTTYSNGEDYVFSFTPSSNICVDVSLSNTPSNSSPGLFLSSGCPDAGVHIVTATGNGGSTISINNVSLITGNTYYFVIDNNTAGGTGCLTGFEFSVTLSTGGPSANEDCAAAVNIPVTTAANCTGPIDYHNKCALPVAAGNIPLPGCGIFSDGLTGDVWFTFTSSNTNVHVISIDQGTSPAAEDLAMAVYSGTCGSLTLVNCDDNSNGMMPALPVVPPAAGTIYFVRVWSNTGTHPGNFRICVVNGCTAQNDSCSTAIPLTIGQYTFGDNSCATAINETMGPEPCWDPGQLNTVWYSFIAATTSMNINVHLLSLYDSQIALYESIGPCSSLNQIFCNDNTLSSCGLLINRNSEINATGLVTGNTYYIRLDGRGSNTGTFEIIVQPDTIPFPALFAQDCPLAIPLCSNNAITVSNPVYSGSGNICDVQENTTCLSNGETNSVFYTFNVTGTGAGTPVEFTITPNGLSNCDFMLWCIDTVFNGGDLVPAVPNYCDNLSNTSMFPAAICNYSFQGITGCSAVAGLCNMICYQNYSYNDTGMTPAVVVPNGMTATFLLLVNNDLPSGFTLDWMGTPLDSIPPSLVWNGGSSSDWNDPANWNQGTCGIVPDCNNQIRTVIAPGNNFPILFSSASVSDIVISSGATLMMMSGATLSVCGNFMNYGQLNFGQGTTVKFIGNRNTVIGGIPLTFFNSFRSIEVAKSPGATLTLQTDLYAWENDSIYSGIFNTNGNDIYIGGNFYNYNGNNSYVGANSSNLQFTALGSLSQHFRNDSTPLVLHDVSMLQNMNGYLILDTNATSDLIVNGSLYLGSGIIKTGAQRKVKITSNQPAACDPGFTWSYVDGNLTRSIAPTTGIYEFPVGDSVRGYQRFAIEFVTAPVSGYKIDAKFNQWNVLPAGSAVIECSNSGWDVLPVFDQGYWTLDASIAFGVGTYTAHAFPGNVTNNTGLSFSIMKASSNNGQGPWTMEGRVYCPSTSTHVQRDSLNSFSDFAVVQSDLGNSIYDSPTEESFLKVIPNPANGKATLYFENSNRENYTISMLDLTGRTVLKNATTNNFLELNLEGIDKGIYLLDVNNQNHSEVLKLIVQ